MPMTHPNDGYTANRPSPSGYPSYQQPLPPNAQQYDQTYRGGFQHPQHQRRENQTYHAGSQASTPSYQSTDPSFGYPALTQRPPMAHAHSQPQAHTQQQYGAYSQTPSSHPSYRTQPSPPTAAYTPSTAVAYTPSTAQSLGRASSSPGVTGTPQDLGNGGWPAVSSGWNAHRIPGDTGVTANGQSLLPPLDIVTPGSAASSQSLDGYSSGYSSAGPTSAPANGSSYFPVTAHAKASRSQSNSMIESPLMIKRSSEEPMYNGSALGSGDDGSASPQGRYSQHTGSSQDGRQYPQYPNANVYHASGASYDANMLPPPSTYIKDEPPPASLPHPLIPSHREPSGSRSNGNPPPGVQQCVSCGIINSPEWRKGEGGVKNLCNA